MSKPKVSIFLLSYILIVAAGIFFCIAPSSAFDTIDVYRSLSLAWGLFYIFGGSASIVAIVLGWFKPFRRRQVMLNYFEMAGLILIITSNLIYSSVLGYTGILSNEQNIIAAALVILAATAIFPYRISKMREQIKLTELPIGGDSNE